MLRSSAVPVSRAERSEGPSTIVAVQDYAGAWSAERGVRGHRFVYDPDGKPGNCPEPPVRSGWRRDGQGRWYDIAKVTHRVRVIDPV
jgi:hypothetical protein